MKKKIEEKIHSVAKAHRRSEINDEYDIKQHVVSIHHPRFQKWLSNDILLSQFKDEKALKFFNAMIKGAVEILSCIQDPEQAQLECDKILLDAYVIAYTSRNSKDNFMVSKLLTPNGTEEEPEKREIDEELLNKLGLNKDK